MRLSLMKLTINILDKYEINTSAITVDCERCHQPLDLLRDKREWVATYRIEQIIVGIGCEP